MTLTLTFTLTLTLTLTLPLTLTLTLTLHTNPNPTRYAILSERDPLWSACEGGAGGDEAKAEQCMNGWAARLPRLRAQVMVKG